jgi:hydrogenase expression/formation protein HypC
MCLGIPARIIRVDGDFAEADISGAVIRIGVQLLDRVKPGDYVLVHTGYALEILDETEAMETLETLRQLQEFDTNNPSSGI